MMVAKALIAMCAPAILVLAVLAIGSPADLKIDFFEQMAGQKAVTRAFTKAGWAAVPFEIKAHLSIMNARCYPDPPKRLTPQAMNKKT